MFLESYTEQQQTNFSLFCKTNTIQPIDGLTENRIDRYRSLIRGVIVDNLESAYPITESLLSEEEWDLLADDFIANYKIQSPQIWQMPFEFYRFVEENDSEVKTKYPHLMDILLFEWKEIELYMMEDKNNLLGNLASTFTDESKIVINQEFELLQLSYPVHLKPPTQINKEDEGNYFLLLFRAEDKIQFFDIPVFYVKVLSDILQNDLTVYQLVVKQIEDYLDSSPEMVKENLLKFLTAMHSKGFIIGFKN